MEHTDSKEKRERAKRVSIKVSNDIHQWLIDTSAARGITISSLCAGIIGESKQKTEIEYQALQRMTKNEH